MSTQILVESGVENDKAIRFLLTKAPDVSLGAPSGKMITDSKKITFVYLFDKEENYIPVHFTQAVWPLMAAALSSDTDPELSWEGQTVTLTGFREELDMLIYNIEGNNNYGDAFSTAVERVFAEQLQSME